MVVVTVKLEDKVAEQLSGEALRQNTTLEQFPADNTVKIHSHLEFQTKLSNILKEDHELLRWLA